ncbi:DUF6087 family protein [Streptomyces sp. NPDC005408]|uniref:DUF6087 family protein n=1 Tax=Streptomyces sp. NPDC005408 TaxID=3155341 RepID=UPI0033B69938
MVAHGGRLPGRRRRPFPPPRRPSRSAARRTSTQGLTTADGPLDRWTGCREKRLRPVDEKKAVTLGAGPQHAAHVDPDAPRLIVEWDGFAWQPLGARTGSGGLPPTRRHTQIDTAGRAGRATCRRRRPPTAGHG